jgi:hypothetical protein
MWEEAKEFQGNLNVFQKELDEFSSATDGTATASNLDVEVLGALIHCPFSACTQSIMFGPEPLSDKG